MDVTVCCNKAPEQQFDRVIAEIKKRIPTNINTATILLHLKSNKDPTLPSSYHPLLLNTNTKIISKALGTRMKTVIPTRIQPKHEYGFIISIQSTSMCILLNLIHYKSYRQILYMIDDALFFLRENFGAYASA